MYSNTLSTFPLVACSWLFQEVGHTPVLGSDKLYLVHRVAQEPSLVKWKMQHTVNGNLTEKERKVLPKWQV